jgi:hypothetical protein
MPGLLSSTLRILICGGHMRYTVAGKLIKEIAIHEKANYNL